MGERSEGANLMLTRAQLAKRETLTDDMLIDIATTCSNRAVALGAEMTLRLRYPSRVKIKRPKRELPPVAVKP